MKEPDTIRIHRLRAVTTIGVPDAERGSPQEVEICLRLVPRRGFSGINDDLAGTVDYHAICRRILRVAAARERRLIETLAEDIAGILLDEFPLAEAGVEVRKFILPETEYVAVKLTRAAD